jgi:hypothetical protein
MHVYKGETKPPSLAAHDLLTARLVDGSLADRDAAAEHIDVTNLTGHLFALMFCFTTDWAQGAALLDRGAPEARWFWLHWDLDQSFDLRGIVPMQPWEQPVLELVTLEAPIEQLEAWGIVTDQRHTDRHMEDIRRLLFLALLQDPEYVRGFLDYVTEALNHRLTPAFFDDLLARYAVLDPNARGAGRVDLRAYFVHRPEVVRREVARHFGLPEPFTVRLDGPPRASYRIDGFDRQGDYEGRYFAGQTVRLEVGAADRPRFSHWLIEGQRREGTQLELAATENHLVRAVFADR